MCFQAVKGVTIAHTALCPLTASRMSISWLPAGITVTYIPSNDNRAPATVIYASQCGQSVASSNQGTEDRPFPHGFSQHVTRRAHRASNPPPPLVFALPTLTWFLLPTLPLGLSNEGISCCWIFSTQQYLILQVPRSHLEHPYSGQATAPHRSLPPLIHLISEKTPRFV